LKPSRGRGEVLFNAFAFLVHYAHIILRLDIALFARDASPIELALYVTKRLGCSNLLKRIRCRAWGVDQWVPKSLQGVASTMAQ
jgi:hypothetical protein